MGDNESVFICFVALAMSAIFYNYAAVGLYSSELGRLAR
jgi:hypothetical protein